MNEVIEYTSRDLPCSLTATELLERGATLAAASEHGAMLREQAAALNREARSELKTAARLATVIHAKQEIRLISCEWRADWHAGTKSLIRTDTGDVVETVPLTAADKQARLPDVPPLTTPAPKPARKPRTQPGHLTAVPPLPSAPPMLKHHEHGPNSPTNTPPNTDG